MEIKNRLLIVIFFIILTPILAIVGFVITSLINPRTSFLPYEIIKDVNWFSQNPELSHNLALGFWIASGIFGIIAIYNIFASLFDGNISDSDLN